jgi:hypothetical protein
MLNILFVITLIDVMVANEVDLDVAFGWGKPLDAFWDLLRKIMVLYAW